MCQHTTPDAVVVGRVRTLMKEPHRSETAAGGVYLSVLSCHTKMNRPGKNKTRLWRRRRRPSSCSLPSCFGLFDWQSQAERGRVGAHDASGAIFTSRTLITSWRVSVSLWVCDCGVTLFGQGAIFYVQKHMRTDKQFEINMIRNERKWMVTILIMVWVIFQVKIPEIPQFFASHSRQFFAFSS